MTKETAVFTIGQNRGKPRLWIDGPRLARAGFTGGTLYACRATPGRIEMHAGRDVTPEDKAKGWAVRRITGRPGGKPIADMIGATVATAFPNGGRVQATFTPGRVVITAAPAEAEGR